MLVRRMLLVAAIGLGSFACQKKASGGPAATTAPDTAVDVVPGTAQTFVSGALTSLTADNAAGPPLRPPFTITIATRGQGHADITGVLVAGKNQAISWYGGQPLPVSGTGSLDLAGAPVAISAGGITWTLDGAPRALTAGHFVLGAPVAVGAGGLAEPHDSIAFDAGSSSTIDTRGHATVHLPALPIHLGGPGKLTMEGDFQSRTSAGRRAVHGVTFGTGSYSIDLTPGASGYTISGTLQGPVSFS